MREQVNQFEVYEKSLQRSAKGILQKKSKLIYFTEWLSTFHLICLPEQLTSEAIRNYGIYISQCKTEEGLPYKPAYQNQHRFAVRSFLKYLNRSNLLEYLPTIKEPKLIPTSVLTHKEALKLLESIDISEPNGYRDRAVLELLYSSGMRVSELSQLNVNDIDLKEKTARVMGKGRKERMVVFGKTAAKYIEGYLKGVRSLSNGASSDALFLGIRGNRFSPRGVRFRVELYASRLGFENVSPHTFRRSCTTELVRANANLYHVKELLGHESLNTLIPYTKLNVGDLKKALKKFHPRE